MRNALAVGLFAAAVASPLYAGEAEKPSPAPDRALLVSAAREIMAAQKYCALITLDETGRPQIRTMNPFPPDENMVVWMATSTRSRKVRQIRNDPRVTLYYSNHAEAIGYVALSGHAELVDDMAEILKRKRAYWEDEFPGLKNMLLIKVVPERLEVVNYKAGVLNDRETFRAPSVELAPSSPAAPPK